MGRDGGGRADREEGPGGAAADVPDGEGDSLRGIERRILIAAGLLLGGIAAAGRFGMLPGALCGAVIAYGNFRLIRRILGRAFAGGGTVGKGVAVQYVLKFLGLAGLVYLVVRSGRFDLLGFLIGFTSLFLGVLLEGLFRASGTGRARRS